MVRYLIIDELEKESTWKLFLLSVLTLTIYAGHYVCKQSRTINRFSPEEKIPLGFTNILLILSYTLAFLTVLDLFVVLSERAVMTFTMLNNAWGIMTIFWGFMARKRMNTLLGGRPGDRSWFSGLWTFLFSPYYFNYKLNCLSVPTLPADKAVED